MINTWLRRHRKLLSCVAGSLVVLVAAVAVTGYTMLRHINDQITQVNVTALLGPQPAVAVPQAENILVMGTDDELDQGGGNQTTGQPGTITLLHIAADRRSAEAMSVPRASWVNIPACKMANGATSSPVRSRIGNAYAIGGQPGKSARYGAACLIKTVEQDTGIYVNHFIVVNFTGFKNMVAALGGVEQCLPVPLTDPNSGITLSAGCQLLSPVQALAYERARAGTGASYSDDLGRMMREQALATSLFQRARSKLLDPVALYRFANALASSLTIDSQLGGVRGIYNLERTLHGIPAGGITQFTVPDYPRSKVVPSDTTNVLWKQPQASQVFAAIRADKPVSSSLLG